MSRQHPLELRWAAYGVHLYTASGLLWAFLAAQSIFAADYRWACLWMLVALSVDSTDGFLARRIRVAEVLPKIDGRRLDDIVDFLNYTFIPLLLIGRAGWVPEPRFLWLFIPAAASILAFSNKGAKEEAAGFFLGFPSYWNIFAIYVVIWLDQFGPFTVLGWLLLLSLLTVLPIRFVYPSRTNKFRLFFNLGAVIWITLLAYLIWLDPEAPEELVLASLAYPVLYCALSFLLDLQSRRQEDRRPNQ